MSWPDAISVGLPSPRDDEPANLRQDLVDELNDHLQSALQRELRAVPDVEQARRNVLARFGDPRRVLCELWYQAMKEQIMSQRVMLIMGAVMVVACLVALGMTWWLVQQSRDVQAALLEKIAALSAVAPAPPPITNPNPSEWVPVKTRLVLNDGRKSPAVGFYGDIVGHVLSDTQNGQITAKCDEQGVLDFGLIRTGSHSLSLYSPAGISGISAAVPIVVRPGEAIRPEFVCPVPAAEVEVGFTLSWPDDLRQQEIWTACQLQREPEIIERINWVRRPTILILDAAGRIVRRKKDALDPFRYTITAGGVRLNLGILQSEPPQLSTLELPAGPYRVNTLVAFDASTLDKLGTRQGPPVLATGDGGPIEIAAESSARVTIPITETMIDEARKKLAKAASKGATASPAAEPNSAPLVFV